MRVAVIGASGFVGGTLVERLLRRNDCEVAPFIHSSGNSWRLARLGIDLHLLDLRDRDAVKAALKGCTHVVNCSRGDDDVMFAGLRNMLDVSREQGVERFVHLSSTMVYGDPPHPQSTREDAPTEPQKGTYGWVKLQQDQMVRSAAGAGLSSIVLCPPNISGPNSYFIVGVLGALRKRSLALVDGGENICMLADVENLSSAIELALVNGPRDGRRMFITDDEPIAWRALVQELMPLVPDGAAPRSIERAEIEKATRPRPVRISLARSVKHLVSSDVRAALRKDPLWAKTDAFLRNSVKVLGAAMEDRVRLSVEGPLPVTRPAPFAGLDLRLSAQQLRGVVHQPTLAKESLGYRPAYSFAESMAAFRRWYLTLSGSDTEFADLIAALD